MDLSKVFHYDPHFPPDIRPVGESVEDGLAKRLFNFATPFGRRRIAELYRPETGAGPFPAVLYLHWYEPEEPHTSNRRQFQEEAAQVAKQGAVCLMIETMWSDLDYFLKRTQADDWEMSVRQVVEIRQALDLLLAEPGADPARLACIGHDFGGMYAVAAGAVDPRPSHYVIMAATPRFPDWFLYYPPIEDPARTAFIEQMQPIDPITLVPRLAPAPVLFQFGDNDPHVPPECAEEFFAAAQSPKESKIYQAGHGLNHQAKADRIAWLTQQLGLE